MRRATLGFLLVAVSTALSRPARAEEDPGPAPNPPPPRKGIFFEAAVGPGLFVASSGADGATRHFNGGTVSFQGLLGGHLSQSFVFGVGYLRDEVFALRARGGKAGAAKPDLDDYHFFLSSEVFFGDLALSTQPELHVQAFAGLSTLFVDGRAATGGAVDDPSGFALGAALGWEIRLAAHLAVGTALRLTWAPLQVTERTGTDVNVLVPALLVTARYD